MKAFQYILLLTLLLASLPVFSQDVVVISNNSVTDDSIDKGTVQKIYLGKKTQWSNGEKITPVTLSKGNAVHATFMKNVVGKSPGQFNAFWTQAIFTGKGTPPRSFATETELMAFVANNKGAIGYVSSSTPLEGVKTLSVGK